MQLSQFFHEFTFHDSGLERMQYDPADTVCRLKITLLNYDQRWYQEGEPEMIVGEIVFRGVRELKIEPSEGLFKEDGTSDGEILRVRQGDEEVLNCWTFDVIGHQYSPASHSYFTLTLCADEVEWHFVAEYNSEDDLRQE
jgi:hypothetical protein